MYGGLHALAWHLDFRTACEQNLWRFAVVFIVVFGPAVIVLFTLCGCVGILSICVCSNDAMARIFLVTECLIVLFDPVPRVLNNHLGQHVSRISSKFRGTVTSECIALLLCVLLS